jgi:cytochrome c-type biogenesis protein CcmE
MTRKKRRIMLLAIGGVFLASAAVLVGVAMRDTIVFFFSPSEVLEKAIGPDQRLRIGGLVAVGSLVRGEGATITFDVTDNAETIPATFTGVLPDLFREGQGVIAEGYLRGGVFEADEILAKHDENYMPKEVADALKEKGLYKGETN